ncbi:M12 family metallo-peptidase [Flavobacterium paronense]|uniref:Reprolysin-like metallopeptidase n=1 Tax=Flavobacterium paronense TaxID=1392775 RepID=A0ABV5GG93_9FLAO|nr:zinc-dependent metalloprotease family protein [Flavobacterium paronense]MDN3678608.1 M12 family metallo-peptidase [Flavobacterium paronense]
MKCKLLIVALVVASSVSFAQNKSSMWSATTKKSNMVPLEARMQLPERNLFNLNLLSLKSSLSNVPERMATSKSNAILSIPNAEGVLEKYSVYENSTMDPALAAKYPEIKSYIGIGIDNPTATAYFSVSPLGFKSMVLAADKSAVFIEPISADLETYTVYRKSDKAQSLTRFECSVIDAAAAQTAGSTLRPNADDAVLRTFRLAMSCTGEYTAYFGGTKALALAAINNSITRCNGVFEKDFGARFIIIANTDLVIYTSASTDPYSAAASMSQWNAQLQSTLTSVIGEANYDLGHLFGATGGGGNAGCIGCICTNGSKGSGITSPADGIPSGDNFDIDYVAHEIGHQMGANHTFTHSNEGSGVQMEPGSGSTIMGYAGITALDVQPHSDAFFHAVSIQQVTNNIKAKTCSVNIATGNAIPTASAGLDYTIPKSTPFMLTGAGTDANGDALTYNWEEMDNQTTSAAPSATKTTGVNFRSYNSTASPTRYFPRMASVLTGATTTAGTELTVEALSSVARTMNFRVTVRDNRAGGPANNSDDMIVTVNATAGPFTVSSPNTAVSYVGGSSQTVTWAVAGTTANGVNCANVDVLLSTDAGATWSTLLSATPNDGTEAVTIPNTPGTTNRIMVKGTNHIFFDVSNTNFTITAGSTDTVAPTAPTLSASGTTQTTTNLSWSGATDNVAVTSYDIYKDGVLLGSTASTTYTVSGLVNTTTYVFTVKAKDAAGNASITSNAVSVTTLSPAPDTTAPTAPTLSASGTTLTSTVLSWVGSTDNVAVTGYDVYQDGVLKTSTSSTTLTVTGLSSSTAYAFYVQAKDAANNISLASNTVTVTTLTPDTTAPTAPTLSASGTTATTTNLSWTGATDNVAVTGYDVYKGGVFLASTTATTYAVTGLTASTAYTFTVKAKDAAGNASLDSNTVSVTTLVNTVTYCASTSSITTDERIGKVVFGTISNTSTGTAGYENFTALSTNAVRGTAYTITITPAWTSTVYKEGYAVWIDYNGNGVFTDAGEKVWTKAASTTTPVTGTFTIPATATLGATRMRVQMNYNATPTSSCQSFTYGQVEDYTVNITATARINDANTRVSFNLYPNPVKGDILNISNLESTSTYRIYNMMGQELGNGKIENESIYVGSLKAGTFLIEVSNGTSTSTKRFIKE